MKVAADEYGLRAADLEALLRYYCLSHGLVNKVLWCDLVAKILKNLIPGDLLAEEAKVGESVNMR